MYKKFIKPFINAQFLHVKHFYFLLAIIFLFHSFSVIIFANSFPLACKKTINLFIGLILSPFLLADNIAEKFIFSFRLFNLFFLFCSIKDEKKIRENVILLKIEENCGNSIEFDKFQSFCVFL